MRRGGRTFQAGKIHWMRPTARSKPAIHLSRLMCGRSDDVLGSGLPCRRPSIGIQAKPSSDRPPVKNQREPNARPVPKTVNIFYSTLSRPSLFAHKSLTSNSLTTWARFMHLS